ncbi:spore cortex-lytic enzyme [Paenibacillus sp. JX-17]|uniref:Spore cortex-lytic enzyme n=1 Tax=Paenibacillus lacisoli TaxID=3064525 RepID=A0ABT9CA63_9BACL|nr:spore cortex-lytic enzyme [Paenibacillus sp. JX-17]MDO7905770.1 spore cortex-lytic enzyme [Paenibacillus sp. JX-17]
MRKMSLWILAGVLLLSAALYTNYLYAESARPIQLPQQQESRPEAVPTFSSEKITYGSYGQDVYELQSRLKYLGFYYGQVDSTFGSKTVDSVKWFQSEFGITPDGVVGAKTKLKLYNATKDWKPTETPLHKQGQGGTTETGQAGQAGNEDDGSMASANSMGLSENELKMMANAVYGEARGEPFEGMVAVAAVILNRVKSPSFPNTPTGVIFQPGAFTAVADGQIWLTPNDTARQAVQQALNGWDPSGGCIYYFNPKTATSKWIWSRPQVKTIGQHIFCM